MADKMREEQKKYLRKKGWSDPDIKKAETIMEESHKQDKSRSGVHTNRVVFWGMLFVMVIGNTLVSLILIPILLAFNRIAADIFVAIIGFVIGLWFNLLVWDIDHITRRHHLIAALTIPGLAVVNLYAITRITNAINDVFVITDLREDPLVVSAIYVISFILPYLWTVFAKKKIKKYQY